MSDDTRALAEALEQRKQYVEAAARWESLGDIERAVGNHRAGGNLERAVELAIEHDLPASAAEILVEANDFERAAMLFKSAGDLGAAARAFRQGGRVVEAADMFEQASELKEAARLYDSVGDHLRAGELYDKCGEVEASARAYERAIQLPEGTTATRREISDAAEILTRVKSFDKAAQIYVQAQEVRTAVEMFVRMGEVAGAAQLLANCQGDVGHEILQRVDPRDRSALDFARLFELARDYRKAARLYEACGEWLTAGRLFERCHDYHQAGEMYAEAAEVERAAQMFEKASSFAHAGDLYLRAGEALLAAACYELGGDFFQSGSIYFDAERFDKAMELLQKVDDDAPRFVDASLLIAEILRRKGFIDLAVDRYRNVLRSLPCSRSTIEYFYRLACILTEKVELAEAERLLREVTDVDADYRDASQRLGDLRDQLAATAAESSAEPADDGDAPATDASPHSSAPGDATTDESPTVDGGVDPEPRPAKRSLMVGRMDGFDILSATSLFDELSLQEMKRFWEICDHRQLSAGATVVEEGVEGDGLFVIRRGAVDVVKGGETLIRLHQGEFFGEMSLVDLAARTSAAIIAATDVDLIFLGREAFERLMNVSDTSALKMYRKFVATLCERLRRANENLTGKRAS